jgi:hypothetical protein
MDVFARVERRKRFTRFLLVFIEIDKKFFYRGRESGYLFIPRGNKGWDYPPSRRPLSAKIRPYGYTFTEFFQT